MLNPDEEGIKQPLDNEISKAIEIVENNKKIVQSNLQ